MSFYIRLIRMGCKLHHRIIRNNIEVIVVLIITKEIME
jgi:hypothetical protein